MKKLFITSECNGCGSCFAMSSLVQEDDEGNAVVVAGGLVPADKETEASKLVEICPVKAIKLEEESDLDAQEESFYDILREFRDWAEDLKKAAYPRKDEFHFEMLNDYSISIPSGSGEYKYNYSSRDKAERAYRDAFNASMYSKIDTIIQGIVLDYKVKYLGKYYICDGSISNYYDQYNEEISNKLKEYEIRFSHCSDKQVTLPNNFSEFKVYPTDEKYSKAKDLLKNEEFNTEIVNDIRRKFDNYDYSPINKYVDLYCDTDSREEYAGRGLFGDKYKETWCYSHLKDAFRELANDIIYICGMYDIEEPAHYCATSCIDDYNSAVRSALRDRSHMLSRL